ncbi:Bifunctional purine biosynthesis protein PurH [Coemansia sp. RSA 1939]|nr:Bifunctional purine biosynthesis protein PurH [Coemansia sp. RSA 1939]
MSNNEGEATAETAPFDGQNSVDTSPLLRTGAIEATSTVVSEETQSSLRAGITWPCLVSAAIICISPLQYGYHIAELNTPKNIIISCNKDAVYSSSLPLCLPMGDAMYSVCTSIFAIGGLLGSLSAGWMAERWGRRGALVYNNVSYVLGPLLMAFAVSPVMLAAGRFVSGFGSGASVVIAPLYLSEIAPIKYRGTLNMLNQLSIVAGILMTLVIGMLANSGPYWRISVGFGLVLACLYLLLFTFAVESPRYLWSHNMRAEARIVLRTLRHTSNVEDEVAGWPVPSASSSSDYRPPSQVASSEAGNTEEQPLSQQEGGLLGAGAQDGAPKPGSTDCVDGLMADNTSGPKVTVLNIFRFAQYRKAWVLVLFLHFGQQLSGINTVFYYSSSVLEKMFSSHVSSILTMTIGVLNVVATAFGMLFVDRFGRRPLLFSSMTGMIISVTLLGVSLARGFDIMAAVSLYLVVASFAPGYGPVPFLLGTEFFDVLAAGAGGSWALAANWIGTFIVAVSFLPVENLIGEWVFAIFVGALLLCEVVFYIYIPETKGRPIEEIAKKLA